MCSKPPKTSAPFAAAQLLTTLLRLPGSGGFYHALAYRSAMDLLKKWADSYVHTLTQLGSRSLRGGRGNLKTTAATSAAARKQKIRAAAEASKARAAAKRDAEERSKAKSSASSKGSKSANSSKNSSKSSKSSKFSKSPQSENKSKTGEEEDEDESDSESHSHSKSSSSSGEDSDDVSGGDKDDEADKDEIADDKELDGEELIRATAWMRTSGINIAVLAFITSLKQTFTIAPLESLRSPVKPPAAKRSRIDKNNDSSTTQDQSNSVVSQTIDLSFSLRSHLDSLIYTLETLVECTRATSADLVDASSVASHINLSTANLVDIRTAAFACILPLVAPETHAPTFTSFAILLKLLLPSVLLTFSPLSGVHSTIPRYMTMIRQFTLDFILDLVRDFTSLDRQRIRKLLQEDKIARRRKIVERYVKEAGEDRQAQAQAKAEAEMEIRDTEEAEKDAGFDSDFEDDGDSVERATSDHFHSRRSRAKPGFSTDKITPKDKNEDEKNENEEGNGNKEEEIAPSAPAPLPASSLMNETAQERFERIERERLQAEEMMACRSLRLSTLSHRRGLIGTTVYRSLTVFLEHICMRAAEKAELRRLAVASVARLVVSLPVTLRAVTHFIYVLSRSNKSLQRQQAAELASAMLSTPGLFSSEASAMVAKGAVASGISGLIAVPSALSLIAVLLERLMDKIPAVKAKALGLLSIIISEITSGGPELDPEAMNLLRRAGKDGNEVTSMPIRPRIKDLDDGDKPTFIPVAMTDLGEDGVLDTETIAAHTMLLRAQFTLLFAGYTYISPSLGATELGMGTLADDVAGLAERFVPSKTLTWAVISDDVSRYEMLNSTLARATLASPIRAPLSTIKTEEGSFNSLNSRNTDITDFNIDTENKREDHRQKDFSSTSSLDIDSFDPTIELEKSLFRLVSSLPDHPSSSAFGQLTSSQRIQLTATCTRRACVFIRSSPFHPGLPGVQRLLEVLRLRALDPRPGVRKSAVSCIESIISSLRGSVLSAPGSELDLFTADDFQALFERCSDVTSGVRRQALNSICSLIQTFPQDTRVQKMWLGAVVPLTCDSEATVSDRAKTMLTEYVLLPWSMAVKEATQRYRRRAREVERFHHYQLDEKRRRTKEQARKDRTNQDIGLRKSSSVLISKDSENNSGIQLDLDDADEINASVDINMSDILESYEDAEKVVNEESEIDVNDKISQPPVSHPKPLVLNSETVEGWWVVNILRSADTSVLHYFHKALGEMLTKGIAPNASSSDASLACSIYTTINYGLDGPCVSEKGFWVVVEEAAFVAPYLVRGDIAVKAYEVCSKAYSLSPAYRERRQQALRALSSTSTSIQPLPIPSIMVNEDVDENENEDSDDESSIRNEYTLYEVTPQRASHHSIHSQSHPHSNSHSHLQSRLGSMGKEHHLSLGPPPSSEEDVLTRSLRVVQLCTSAFVIPLAKTFLPAGFPSDGGAGFAFQPDHASMEMGDPATVSVMGPDGRRFSMFAPGLSFSTLLSLSASFFDSLSERSPGKLDPLAVAQARVRCFHAVVLSLRHKQKAFQANRKRGGNRNIEFPPIPFWEKDLIADCRAVLVGFILQGSKASLRSIAHRLFVMGEVVLVSDDAPKCLSAQTITLVQALLPRTLMRNLSAPEEDDENGDEDKDEDNTEHEGEEDKEDDKDQGEGESEREGEELNDESLSKTPFKTKSKKFTSKNMKSAPKSKSTNKTKTKSKGKKTRFSQNRVFVKLPSWLRSFAFVALGKFCLKDKRLAQQSISVFIRELDSMNPQPLSPFLPPGEIETMKRNLTLTDAAMALSTGVVSSTSTPSSSSSSSSSTADSTSSSWDEIIIRNNVLAILCDLARTFTSIVDPYLSSIALCLRDSSPLVRRHCVMILTQLLLEDFIKWRGVLFFRLLSSALDRDYSVATSARDAVLQVIRQRGTVADNRCVRSFVEAIFFFNASLAHPSFNQFLVSEFEDPETENVEALFGGSQAATAAATASTAASRAQMKARNAFFTLPGDRNIALRGEMYEFLAKTASADIQKLSIISSVAKSVFGAINEGSLALPVEPGESDTVSHLSRSGKLEGVLSKDKDDSFSFGTLNKFTNKNVIDEFDRFAIPGLDLSGFADSGSNMKLSAEERGRLRGVLLDSFRVLRSPLLYISTSGGGTGAGSNSGVGDGEGDALSEQLRVQTKLVSSMFKKSLVFGILPTILEFKRRIEPIKSLTPILRELMGYLRDLITNHGSDLAEAFETNKELKEELDYDIRQWTELEAKEKREREERIKMENAQKQRQMEVLIQQQRQALIHHQTQVEFNVNEEQRLPALVPTPALSPESNMSVKRQRSQDGEDSDDEGSGESEDKHEDKSNSERSVSQERNINLPFGTPVKRPLREQTSLTRGGGVKQESKDMPSTDTLQTSSLKKRRGVASSGFLPPSIIKNETSVSQSQRQTHGPQNVDLEAETESENEIEVAPRKSTRSQLIAKEEPISKRLRR